MVNPFCSLSQIVPLKTPLVCQPHWVDEIAPQYFPSLDPTYTLSNVIHVDYGPLARSMGELGKEAKFFFNWSEKKKKTDNSLKQPNEVKRLIGGKQQRVLRIGEANSG